LITNFNGADVVFQLEDGTCSAHKAILMCRCDMMDAMFRGDFRESSAKVVRLSLLNY
jgi:Rho-related BTB domain-containing protein 1/2